MTTRVTASVIPQNDLFESFKREKQFLKGVTPRTIGLYNEAWIAFHRYGKAEITEHGVKDFMMVMMESGMTPGGANVYARSMNSFFTWLFENGHTEKRLKAPLHKEEKKVLKTYKQEDVAKIISYKPNDRVGKRMMAMLYLLIDTGARINEVLVLKRKSVDFDNLLITLYGKGRKERIIPISLECRKALFRHLQTHSHELVFCTRNGDRLMYDNIRRDFLGVLDAVGVEKTEGAFHAFRRYFGKQYVRNGGNVLYLQKTFGHASLETTQIYVNADEDDLKLTHKSASPLESLKSRR